MTRICFPISPIIVTVLYGGFVYVIQSQAPECLNEPCSSEGVDSSIANWGSDFFVAGAMFLFALHLYKCDRPVRKAGIFSQVYMAMAHILWGVAHWMFPNTGARDGRGNLGYFITWGAAFFFSTQSLLEHDSFIRSVFKHALSEPRCCGHRFLKVFQSLVVFTMFGVLTGSVWCAAGGDDHVDAAVDEFEGGDSGNGENMCHAILFYSENAWYISYALFWIPASLLLRVAVIGQGQSSFFFQASPHTGLVIGIVQWTVGFMILIYMRLIAFAVDQDMRASYYGTYYGAYIFHYGALLAFTLSHMLAYAMPLGSWQRRAATNGNDTERVDANRSAEQSGGACDVETGVVEVDEGSITSASDSSTATRAVKNTSSSRGKKRQTQPVVETDDSDMEQEA